MPVARTTVRTGALDFDWSEDFDFDVCKVSKMQVLLYSWDMDTKHQLCFTATVPVAHVVNTHLGKDPPKPDHPLKLAIKLEPKGVLYSEVSFADAPSIYSRVKTSKKNALFGADLKEVVLRERSGLNVPLLVQRCVKEVERRGFSQLGLYRLSGSNKRKKQLREELERNARLVDISPEGVSDINVITGPYHVVTLSCDMLTCGMPCVIIVFIRSSPDIRWKCYKNTANSRTKKTLKYTRTECYQS